MVVTGCLHRHRSHHVNTEIAVLGNPLHEPRMSIELGRERDLIAGDVGGDLVVIREGMTASGESATNPDWMVRR